MASPLDDTFLAPNCSHPLDLIDTLKFTTQTYCLFLDLDGTLAAFQNNPQHSFIPPATLQLLRHCIEQTTPVIAVTGRDLSTAEKLLASLPIPIAGLHGLDIKIDAEQLLHPDLSAINFDRLKQQISKACAPYPDLVVENEERLCKIQLTSMTLKFLTIIFHQLDKLIFIEYGNIQFFSFFQFGSRLFTCDHTFGFTGYTTTDACP